MIRWKWRDRYVKLVSDSGSERFRSDSKWELSGDKMALQQNLWVDFASFFGNGLLVLRFSLKNASGNSCGARAPCVACPIGGGKENGECRSRCATSFCSPAIPSRLRSHPPDLPSACPTEIY